MAKYSRDAIEYDANEAMLALFKRRVTFTLQFVTEEVSEHFPEWNQRYYRISVDKKNESLLDEIFDGDDELNGDETSAAPEPQKQLF